MKFCGIKCHYNILLPKLENFSNCFKIADVLNLIRNSVIAVVVYDPFSALLHSSP